MLKRRFAALFTIVAILASLGAAVASPAPQTVYMPQQIAQLDHEAAEDLVPDSPAQPIPFSSTYVGNSRSGIFHYADCRYVGRMSENHKVYFDGRDDAVNAGYRPCKVCRP